METGESSASITARMDDGQQERVMDELRNGAVLYQPKSGFDYYVRRGAEYGGMGSLSSTRVRKLENAGILELVGVKTYALGKEQSK